MGWCPSARRCAGTAGRARRRAASTPDLPRGAPALALSSPWPRRLHPPQAALHKSLAHREYPHQPHADCFAQPKVISGPSTRALGAGAPPPPENATGGCFRGVLQYVMQYA